MGRDSKRESDGERCIPESLPRPSLPPLPGWYPFVIMERLPLSLCLVVCVCDSVLVYFCVQRSVCVIVCQSCEAIYSYNVFRVPITLGQT
jgi:hypothetical protein